MTACASTCNLHLDRPMGCALAAGYLYALLQFCGNGGLQHGPPECAQQGVAPLQRERLMHSAVLLLGLRGRCLAAVQGG